jgi:hypothetical protein
MMVPRAASPSPMTKWFADTYLEDKGLCEDVSTKPVPMQTQRRNPSADSDREHSCIAPCFNVILLQRVQGPRCGQTNQNAERPMPTSIGLTGGDALTTAMLHDPPSTRGLVSGRPTARQPVFGGGGCGPPTGACSCRDRHWSLSAAEANAQGTTRLSTGRG